MGAAAALALVTVHPAQAIPQKAIYYTIGVTPPSASSSALFLTVQSPFAEQVVLGPHNPADLRHQWAAVYPIWPHAPETYHCGSFDFCPPPDMTPHYKLVNRSSGKCLTARLPWQRFRSTPVIQQACTGYRTSKAVSAAQTWLLQGFENRGGGVFVTYAVSVTSSPRRPDLAVPSPPAKPLSLVKTKTSCLEVRGAQYHVGAPVQAGLCPRPTRPRTWNQLFLVRRFAEVSCDVVGSRLCGVPPR